ncbi:MAG: sn-glycerol-3-phosphate ABC transporter ATP-binding protein UgpC [Nitrospirae bacterium]|nr:sn-glycerol-3-phosphate ABC transporter ATP-binding protein UgpC [Nitrospirota bacterium]
MSKVVLKNVKKVFSGDILAVNDANIEIADKEFMVLVGPSGCGKSTTLRMLAGLEEITEGEIYIGDRLVNDIPPKDRDIAMVFQNYALYPHMNVYNNMAFGLRLRKFPREEIDRRVRYAAEILGINELLDRKPRALSGGQRQRVAVGRAIVRKPKVFLFDEPLSNLDAKMRVQMRAEISKLHARLQATMIYVTHDQTEAMTMGDRIVVMKDGFLLQIADPLSLYEKPANKFVAGFIGTPPMNFMEGRLIKKDEGLYFNEGRSEVKVIEDMIPKLTPYLKKKIIFGIRPEDIHDKLFVGEAAPENTIVATVEVVEPMGAENLLYLTTGNHSFIARVEAHSQASVNEDLELVLNMSKAHFFDKETEEVII